MGTRQTRDKLKYNRANYRRYEFNVRLDSKLQALIERYKELPESNLSELIKDLLCAHFGMARYEADSPFSPYYLIPGGERVSNNELDKYF